MCLKYLPKFALSVPISLSASRIKGYQDGGMWVITGFQGGVKEDSRKQAGEVGIRVLEVGITGFLPTGPVPISQHRRLLSWEHLASKSSLTLLEGNKVYNLKFCRTNNRFIWDM